MDSAPIAGPTVTATLATIGAENVVVRELCITQMAKFSKVIGSKVKSMAMAPTLT